MNSASYYIIFQMESIMYSYLFVFGSIFLTNNNQIAFNTYNLPMNVPIKCFPWEY